MKRVTIEAGTRRILSAPIKAMEIDGGLLVLELGKNDAKNAKKAKKANGRSTILSEAQVRDLKRRWQNLDRSKWYVEDWINAQAERFGVCYATISHIVYGLTWQDVEA